MRAVHALLACLLALPACGPSAAARRAQTLIDAGDYAGAAKLAEAELASHPDDGDLWRVRIRASLGQHDARSAVVAYEQWRARRGSDDPTAMRMMAMTTMWQALESPSAQARLAAIQAVERLEIEALADSVADHMGDDEDVVAAAASIAILHAFPQAPHVATDLLGSSDPAARRIVVAGLGRKEKRAADDIRAMADDPDAVVRRAVAQALGSLKDPADTEALTELATDDDDDVRAAALNALAQGKRGDLSALGREHLGDAHLGVRLAALRLLAAAGATKELVPLLTGEDAAMAGHAARALAKTMPAEAMAALDRILGDEDWTVRAGGLNLASSVVGAAGARERAVAALRDAELDVRVTAARLLATDDGRAIDVFVEALAEPGLRLEAAIDLATRGDARGLDTLDALVVDAEPGTRIAAAGAYSRARAIHAGAVTALADDNPAVRIAAAESILDVVPAD